MNKIELWQSILESVSGIPKEEFHVRIEIFPDEEFLLEYCSISSDTLAHSTAIDFFERFLDDEQFTLLRHNVWLRERLYARSDNPYELLLSHIEDTPYSGKMNVLCCRQWKNSKEIESALKGILDVPRGEKSPCLGDFKKVIACYNVFRYQLPRECTIDQAIFDTSRPETRHESASIRFASRELLEQFVSNFGNKTIPTYSKLMANFRFENPDALKVLQELKRDLSLPTCPPCLPPPDLSPLEVFLE